MKQKSLQDKNTGKFCSPNPEPLGKKIVGVRLPESVEAQLRALSGGDLSGFIRQAIAEKLERERQRSCESNLSANVASQNSV